MVRPGDSELLDHQLWVRRLYSGSLTYNLPRLQVDGERSSDLPEGQGQRS